MISVSREASHGNGIQSEMDDRRWEFERFETPGITVSQDPRKFHDITETITN